MTSYSQVIKYLDELELFGIKLGLTNTTELCKILGNPQDSYKIIHIAGTNGKGSVAAMISSILKEGGYKVGLYTSPHLQTFRERMQINAELITQEELVEIFIEVKKAADELQQKGMQVTYFEFTTAMALLYFKKMKCNFAVLETGMGGRLDATNIVKPVVSVITNIELEHTKHLGDTKEEIAIEKAGIIKENLPAVIGERDKKIKQQLLKICKSRNSRAILVENDYESYISLLGKHQKRNAAIAVAAIKNLGIIDDKIISSGIGKTKWPGRLEVIQENPVVVLDAAHNPSGAATVADYLKNKKVILVLGISDDKDMGKIVQVLSPSAKKIIVTKAKYRGADCELLKKEVLKYNKNVEVVETVKEAVMKAVDEAEDKIIVVTGSLFVVGEARELWHGTGV